MTLRHLYYRALNRWRRHRELEGPYDSIYGLNRCWQIEQLTKVLEKWPRPLNWSGYRPGASGLNLNIEYREPRPDTRWFTNVVTRRGKVIS
jgi:hypothetical protein